MLDLQTAAKALGVPRTGANLVFTGVSTDTRSLRPGDLFIALRGERFDGHTFLESAFAAGAAAAMVDARAPVAHLDSPLLIVPDTRLALGRLAALWRERFSMPLVGITGSNGKTTVKDMLAAVLREAAREEAVLATAGNLNNDIGMPLTLLRLAPVHQYAVIEMGMNHLGELRYLTQIARPDTALVNNAGTAHIGEVGSREAIARAKGEIYEGLRPGGVALVNADDDFAELWREMNAGRRVVDFGIEQPAAVSAQYEMSGDATLMTVRTPDTQYLIRLSVPGVHNVRNALATAALAHVLGVRPAHVAAGLSHYAGTSGRLQRKRSHSGAIFIDDTYNANPDSVAAAIDVLMLHSGKRILVLGDMGELGAAGEQLHAEAGTHARRAGVDQLFTLGTLSQAAARSFGSRARHFDDLDALCNALDRDLTVDTTVLVKGSRFMRMERVVQRFINGEPHAHGSH
jgi:UDP-N-acetylmuramoyl-tripeptide--D-alanyl-D-alanine ligase